MTIARSWIARGCQPRMCLCLLAGVLAALLAACSSPSTPPAALSSAPIPDTVQWRDSLTALLDGHRAIIVLFADEKAMGAQERDLANQVGQAIFHENLSRQARLGDELGTLLASSTASTFDLLASMLTYVESGEGLYDADRLAFREVLVDLQQRLASNGTLPAIQLHKRIGDDLEALQEIERNYDAELKQIFNRFAPRAIELKRERWNDYVAHLKRLRSREQILKDYGYIVPRQAPPGAAAAPAALETGEVFGQKLPPKTVVLTFDDGPHRLYSAEIAAILRQYEAPAVFFEVGRNIGSLGADGTVKFGPLAAVSRQLRADGFVLGNHSFTHAQLSKLAGEALTQEIVSTDALLKALDTERAPLFRFPYGAHNAEGLKDIETLKLRSVMWSVDSLDWADPVPNSIVERVVSGVEKADRGIVLFHDIHERAVQALPKILERLSADGYRFAGWDGTGFSLPKDVAPPIARNEVTSGYAASWALVIGIDDYQKWPKLQYAVNDAQAVRGELVGRYGFANDHVIVLTNAEATRRAILAVFEGRLGHEMHKDDRLMVFFAGHGATRRLSSGRTLGYIVPVDSDTEQLAGDAIAMTEIQDIAESLVAKHILFVMDACYSGLGLTRGAAPRSTNFLQDNARRLGREMLTAGGADQMVADGGPSGHSVFTWAVLQGLGGKADLNGDGFITATELAAYVAPAVSGMSRQTPAFGSLPGSEGGEFIFELPEQTEFLNPDTEQLSAEALKVAGQLEASATAVTPTRPVAVTDLQGAVRQVELPKAVAVGARRLAQLANDRGLQLYREQQYAAAAEQFTEALRQRPDFAQAANNLGFVYYKQSQFIEAARWFENTVKLDPSRAIAYLNLGDAYSNAGEAAKAKAAYQTYLALGAATASAAEVRRKLESL